MIKYLIYIASILILPVGLAAQTVSGTVYEKINDQLSPLPGVNIHWAGSQIGTTSDASGKYSIFKPDYYSKLVFSFVGYTSDTVSVAAPEAFTNVTLVAGQNIGEVKIVRRSTGAHIDRMAPILTEKITGAELSKAACCNLAESFTTNASVDAYYSNAVTGAKQIRLLGLDGVYVQMLTENIPTMRGIASTYGLTYIPGPWMEGIMISKGTSSVKNGYESIAGQINVEYLKPFTADKLLLNVFQSNAGRTEANVAAAVKLKPKLGTLVLGHFSNDQTREDHNEDGFMDEPLYRQYNFLNRWFYDDRNVCLHAGFRVLSEDRFSGQMAFAPDSTRDIDHPYGIGIKSRRAEAFVKLGYIFHNRLNSSFGSINSVSYHNQESYYGIRNYDGRQFNYYLNLLYETNVVNEKHHLVSGFSFNLDNYSEKLDALSQVRDERVPGIFTEYTFKPTEHINVLAGMRFDYHNLYGLMFTPRLHARFDINGNTFFRLSAGKGFRSPMVLAENNYFLANSRSIVIEPGLKQEEAWNYGLNVTQNINIGFQPMTLSLDAYRTDFLEQVIVDLDSSVDQVWFSNLHGKSFSNNLQAEVGAQFVRGLETKVAFRLTDVRYDINQVLVEKPLVSRYKGLVVLSYQTPLRKWQFDVTWQLNGPGRIPSTAANPEAYRMEDSFKAYQIINMQITKYFRTWEVYAGVENLTDFRQMHAVIGGDQPFGEYFDSSMIWGPLHGRKLYVGFRYRIAKDE